MKAFALGDLCCSIYFMTSFRTIYKEPDLAQNNYSALDPRYDADTDELASIAVSLEDSERPGRLCIATNAYLEHSARLSHDPEARLASAIAAEDILRGPLSTPDTPGTFNSKTIGAHLPIFAYGWNDESRSMTKQHISDIVQSWIGRLAHDSESQVNTEKGSILELVTTLMLGHIGLEGIRARPSFLRQDSNCHLLEGRHYRWDVTAFSDGTLIEEGEYRLQVKSNDNEPFWPEDPRKRRGPVKTKLFGDHGRNVPYNGLGKYHWEIVPVTSMEIFHIPTGNNRLLAELAEELCGGYTYSYRSVIGDMADRLLDKLCDTGPIPYYERGPEAI